MTMPLQVRLQGFFLVILIFPVKYTVKSICGGDGMSNKSIGSKGVRAGKVIILSLIFLLILFVLIGLLIRFTPLPERWVTMYVLGAVCIACLFIGILAGNVMQRKGILFGALFSIAFLLIVLVVAVLITGTFSQEGIFQIRYLPCIAFGSIGGMIGVNLRNG
jgi:putative membrane protein (TIGR04086 family)